MSSKSGCHRVDCKYLHDHFANEEKHVNLGNAKKQNSHFLQVCMEGQKLCGGAFGAKHEGIFLSQL